MNIRSSSFILLISMLLGSMVSCENREVSEPEAGKREGPEVTSISEQIAFVEASIDDLNALIDAVDAENPALEDAMGAMQAHIEYLGSGVSLKDAGLAAIGLQERVAGAVASVGADQDIADKLDRIEAGVRAWLGSDLHAVYPLAYAQARIDCLVVGMNESKLYIDGIASDVEAGLRGEISADEIGSLDSEMAAQMKAAMEMVSSLSDLATEVRCEYEQVLSFAVSGDDGYEIGNLNSLNKSVELALKSVDESFSGLFARVAECEAQLADILDRIADLEDKVEDLNKLVESIQSLTFMSELSTEAALAFYNMDLSSRYEDGKAKRIPTGNINLNYLVRPASAAKVFADESLQNNGVDIIGYYASTISTKAVDPSDFIDFEIVGVEADPVSGLVTFQVSNELSEDFYMTRCGAKMALSVTSGKTDLTSKFVEIVPKDKSGKVYVESLTVSPESVEIDDDQTARISAKVLPADATVSDLLWTSSNDDVVNVSADGTVTAKGVGEAVITVKTVGIDQWGNFLSATCSVKVNSSIKIMGAGYVEEGGQTPLRVESPNYIDSKYVSWEIGTFTSKDANGAPVGFNTNQAFASIDDNGNVTGLKMYYNASDTVKDYVPLMIRCTIAGAVPVVLYHEIRVVAVQPLGISINGISDNDSQVTTKVGQAIGLYGAIVPEAVREDYFKLSYLGANDGYFAASNVGTTTVTISVQPGGSGQFNYFYPKGKGLSRNITVVVEPCYVKTLSLPASFEMNPNQTATLTPAFTSDVNGKAPTYQDLKWTSSNPSIVSVNATTGEMTSLKEGTVTITATTSHANAVPSGQAQKSASCVVTVKTPVAPISVGNYYYSDGTWGTDAKPSGKIVIGVIFSTANAVASDPKLLADYPSCTNGLVLSTIEYSKAFGDYAYSDMNDRGIALHLDGSTLSRDIPNGYGLTKAYGKYRQTYAGTYDYCVMFDVNTGLPATHNSKVSAPAKSSAWYVPSYYEMRHMYENKAVVNSALSAVSGDLLEDKNYIHATLWTSRWDGRNYDDCTSKYFDMSTGNWGGTYTKTEELPVRVILAF